LEELFHSSQPGIQGYLSQPGRDLFPAVVLLGKVAGWVGEQMYTVGRAGFRDRAQAGGVEDFRERSVGHHVHDPWLGYGDGVDPSQVGQRPDDVLAAECREEGVDELAELVCGDSPRAREDLRAVRRLLADDLDPRSLPRDDVDLDA
jgi:hypothetical protein